ncbi:MAG: holB [Chlamydiales bacterium]|jgi:DNA polymerase-3 subunit delta'|nr:holB [Chlamydiales bacterium]
MFEQLLGNTLIKGYLSRAFENSLSGSYLFYGPPGVGKSLFARFFAEAILFGGKKPPSLAKEFCSSHPDLRILFPEGKLAQHSIDSLRQFSQEVFLSPFSSERKVFIIEEAHRMPLPSANALLKTLEEPASHAIIILLTSDKEALLPTIVSRCAKVPFKRLTDGEIRQGLSHLPAKGIEEALFFAEGSLGDALLYLEYEEKRELQHHLLQCLSASHLTYERVTESADLLAKLVEAIRRKDEEKARSKMLSKFSETLQAQEKALLEKNLEAVSSLAFYREAHSLLKGILDWHKGRFIYHLLGEAAPLTLAEKRRFVALEHLPLTPIEKVERVIQDAITSLERSTALPIVLEQSLLSLC